MVRHKAGLVRCPPRRPACSTIAAAQVHFTLHWLRTRFPAESARAERVSSLESRIAVMRKYLAARAAEAEDPETMLALCGELLDQPDADQAIRTGDVFALLIEHYFKGGEAEK